MTRSEKLSKLANAIREYRGRYNAETKVWIDRPKPMARGRVEVWLDRLKLNVGAELDRIDGFKAFPEFNAWLKSL